MLERLGFMNVREVRFYECQGGQVLLMLGLLDFMNISEINFNECEGSQV